MRPEESTGTHSRCGACGTRNYAFASFCIECGEPLDTGRDEAPSPLFPEFDRRAAAPEGVAHERPQAEPPPQLGAHHWAKWEALVGVLILMLAVAYAVYDWRRTSDQTEAYRKGVSAEQQQDWDRAAVEFERAGDIHDAPRRREEAAQTLYTRDHLYESAVLAARSQSWDMALNLLQQLHDIQPRYLDTERQIATAERQAFTGGLIGLVYLVNSGPNQGLYVRGVQGESIPVPRSDGRSIVRAIAPDGRSFVYDRPSSEQDFLASLTNHKTIVADVGFAGANERVPVLAVVDPDGHISTWPLPRLDRNGRGVFTGGGIWWYSSNGLEVSYCPLPPANQQSVVHLTGTESNRRVAALDAAHWHVIIAEIDAAASGLETRLYLANADGSGLRYVRSAEGAEVPFAVVSPDGHWLLYRTEDRAYPFMKQLWLLSLDAAASGGTTQVDARVLDSVPWREDGKSTRLSAAFLPARVDGSVPGVVVTRATGDVESLELFNMEGTRGTYLWSGEPQAPDYADTSGFSHNGAFVASPRREGMSASLEIVEMNTSALRGVEPAVSLPVPPESQVQAQFGPDDSYLMATVQNFGGANRARRQKIYMAPISDRNSLSAPVLVAVAAMPDASSLPTAAMPAGSSVLAYIDARHDLHAVFYNGTNDVLLDHHVGAVWSLRTDKAARWNR